LPSHIRVASPVRPKVVCHMAASVDGRIATRGWPGGDVVRREYERIHAQYNADAWLCGRTTMEPMSGRVRSEDEVSRQNESEVFRDDFVAPGDFESYAIAVDPSGKLAWQSADVDGDHVIAIVSSRVSNEYLSFLRDRGISYVIAGRDEIALPLALEKLFSRFSIRTIMLEGGGGINGSMLRAGLVDELSLLVVPVADGRTNVPSLFDAGQAAIPVGLELAGVERLDSGIVWLRYRIVSGQPTES
jgi:2,5-diamino-6-(ribosylamino)-4(3H)-pyrimidinone 5'-phosphate reductase